MPWLDGFQPPEIDGAPVPPACRLVTVPPLLPSKAGPVPSPPPHPDPMPATQTPPLLKRNQWLSLLIFLLSNKRGSPPKSAENVMIMAASRGQSTASVLPLWKLSQARGGTRQQGRAEPVQRLAWRQIIQKASDSDSSEEVKG